MKKNFCIVNTWIKSLKFTNKIKNRLSVFSFVIVLKFDIIFVFTYFSCNTVGAKYINK